MNFYGQNILKQSEAGPDGLIEIEVEANGSSTTYKVTKEELDAANQ